MLPSQFDLGVDDNSFGVDWDFMGLGVNWTPPPSPNATSNIASGTVTLPEDVEGSTFIDMLLIPKTTAPRVRSGFNVPSKPQHDMWAQFS